MQLQAPSFLLAAILALGVQSCSTPPAVGSRTLRGSDAMPMLYVPAGQFMMGSDYKQTAYARLLCRHYLGRTAVASCGSANYGDESPAHPVVLKAFWIDRTEVTNAQYNRCEQAGACEPSFDSACATALAGSAAPACRDHPVTMVTRAHAKDYCEWAGGRLPTEAEWEYAARGPEGLIFPWGNAFDGTRLNYCDARCDAGPNDPTVDDGYARTAPVGSYPEGASWVGALDMAGNVREWVAGWYGPYGVEAQRDPAGPESNQLIVPRGGSWLDNPSLARSANRGGNTPDYYRNYYGFRCASD